MFRSIALNTDAMVMHGLSVYEQHPDRIVMRTPSEPGFWSGNSVIYRAVDDPLAQVLRFERDFPDADHVTVLWDVPNLIISPALGSEFVVTPLEVLTCNGPIPARDAPDGIVLRALDGDTDWAQLAVLQSEVALDEGYDMAVHMPYLARRNAARRKQIALGQGQWFGAFDGDLIVGTMGMYLNAQFARYQSVETKKSHRRRGICAALLAYVSGWAQRQQPSALQVIETEAKSDAGRLYAAVGFAPTETLIEASKRGY